MAFYHENMKKMTEGELYFIQLKKEYEQNHQQVMEEAYAEELRKEKENEIKEMGIEDFLVISVPYYNEIHVLFDKEEDMNFYKLSKKIDANVFVELTGEFEKRMNIEEEIMKKEELYL